MKKYEINAYHTLNSKFYGYQKVTGILHTTSFYAQSDYDALDVFHNIIESDAYCEIKKIHEGVIWNVKCVGAQFVFSKEKEEYLFEIVDV